MAAWSGARGRLFLSTVRIVVVADAPTPGGLRAFDAPLAFLRGEKFNQPIFGANNLSAACFSVPAGGPTGGCPPHRLVIRFRHGGCGTLLPAFYGALVRARPGREAPVPGGGGAGARDFSEVAFVDPNDPSVVFLPCDAQPGEISGAVSELYPL